MQSFGHKLVISSQSRQDFIKKLLLQEMFNCQAQPKLKFNRTWLILALLFNSPPTPTKKQLNFKFSQVCIPVRVSWLSWLRSRLAYNVSYMNRRQASITGYCQPKLKLGFVRKIEGQHTLLGIMGCRAGYGVGQHS